MDLFSALSAGLRMGSQYWKELLLLVLMGGEMGVLAVTFFGSREDKNSRLGMIFLAGSWGLISLVSPLLSILKIFTPLTLLILMAGGLVAILIKGNWRSFLPGLLAVQTLIPLIIWVFFLVLFLGYLDSLWLPPYHDSPYHFQFVNNFLSDGGHGWQLFPRLFRSYYHLGFHGITAWLGSLRGGFHPLYLALVGQFFLALFPVTSYFFVVSITENKAAGLISALVAGIGWPMPLHAADWGKYPLILGLMIFPAVVGLIIQQRTSKEERGWLLILLSMISLIWFHSRFAIMLLILLIAYLLVYRWRIGLMSTAVLLVLALGLMLFSPSQVDLPYYLGSYMYPTLGVALFLPFALMEQRVQTLFWVLFALMLYLSSRIILPAFFHRYSFLLIDPGFINTVFVLPLVILAGLGVSSWMKDKSLTYAVGMVVVIVGFLFLNAGEQLSFRPQESTDFSSFDDLIALEWIEGQLPPEGIIFISSKRRLGDWEGQDAGIWIQPLINRKTIPLTFVTAWCDPSLQDKICREYSRNTPLYFYQGQMSRSFSLTPAGQCLGIEEVFSFPHTRIYHLSCE